MDKEVKRLRKLIVSGNHAAAEVDILRHLDSIVGLDPRSRYDMLCLLGFILKARGEEQAALERLRAAVDIPSIQDSDKVEAFRGILQCDKNDFNALRALFNIQGPKKWGSKYAAALVKQGRILEACKVYQEIGDMLNEALILEPEVSKALRTARRSKSVPAEVQVWVDLEGRLVELWRALKESNEEMLGKWITHRTSQACPTPAEDLELYDTALRHFVACGGLCADTALTMALSITYSNEAQRFLKLAAQRALLLFPCNPSISSVALSTALLPLSHSSGGYYNLCKQFLATGASSSLPGKLLPVIAHCIQARLLSTAARTDPKRSKPAKDAVLAGLRLLRGVEEPGLGNRGVQCEEHLKESIAMVYGMGSRAPSDWRRAEGMFRELGRPVMQARVLINLGKLKEARELLSEAKEDIQDAQVVLGVIHNRSGNYKEAIEVLRGVPETVEALLELGRAYFLSGDIPEAQSALKRCLNLDSAYAEPLALSGHCFTASGDLKAAVKHYTTAVKLDPGNAEAGRALADLMLRHGKAESARKVLLAAVGAESCSYWAWRRLARITEGNEEELMLYLQKAVQTGEGEPPRELAEVWSDLGEVYRKQGKFEAALKALEKSQELWGGEEVSDSMLHRLGSLYLTLGMLDKALELLGPVLIPHSAILSSDYITKALQSDINHQFPAIEVPPGKFALLYLYLKALELLGDELYAEGAYNAAEMHWLRGFVILRAVLAESSKIKAFTALYQLLGGVARRLMFTSGELGAQMGRVCVEAYEQAANRSPDILPQLQYHRTLVKVFETRILSSPNVITTTSSSVQGSVLDWRTWVLAGAAEGSIPRRYHMLLQAAELHPRAAEPWVWIAGLCIEAGDAALAKECGAVAQAVDPLFGPLWAVLGLVALSEGDLPIAQQHFMRSIQLQPTV